MVALAGRTLASATLLAAAAWAKTITLNFDDIQVSNEKGCGQGQLPYFNSDYHGTLPEDNASGPMAVYNTTATAACHANTNDAVHIFDQKRATSGSNVAFSRDASFYFQIFPDGAKFINDVSFDISVVFTPQELAKADNVVSIDAEIADFNNLDNIVTFTFHTAKDGFGPYHIHVPNSEKYVFFEADATIGVAGQSSFRRPAAFLDSLALENNVN